MSINLTSGVKSINTGVNLMDDDKKSPTLNSLLAKPPVSVTPNEEQIMEDVSNTQGPQSVTPEPTVEVPQGTSEVPVVPREPEVPEETIEAPLDTQESRVGTQEATGVTLESDTDEEYDPFANSATSVAYLESEDDSEVFSNSISSTYSTEEETNWDYVKKESMQVLKDLNNVAYGGVKAISGNLDLASVPIWAVTSKLGATGQSPFTSTLDKYFPPEDYKIPEVSGSFTDELLRFSQTGMEFMVGGGVANLAAKAGSKGAYLPTLADDIYLSGLSALGYQGVKESGGSDNMALLASFISPSGPEIAKAFYKMSTQTAIRGGIKPTLWLLDKTTDYLPMASLIKTSVKVASADLVQIKKQQLLADPEAMTETRVRRKVREIIVNTPDRVKTIAEQEKEIESIGRWLSSAIPDSPEIRAHVSQMKVLQDNINADLPPEKQIAFTLEQIYAPVLNKTNSGEGLKEVMTTLRVTNGDAYDAQLRKNQEAMFTYLDNKKGTLGPEETKAFTIIFSDQMDQITQVQESIYALANNDALVAQTREVGYRFSSEPLTEELRPAVEKIREMIYTAYTKVLDKMPNDVELDTTPLKDAVTQVYDDLGVFTSNAQVPPYLKQVVKALVNNADEGVSSPYTALKNEASKVSAELNEHNGLIRQVSLEHKKALSEMDPKKPKAIEALKDKQAEENLALNAKRTELLSKSKDLEVQKRSAKQEEAKNAELESVPEPNLVTVKDVVLGLKTVNGLRRKAFKNKEWDKYEVLTQIHDGLSTSMKGLEVVDKDAYNLYMATNERYKQFVKTDFDESVAHTITEKGDHLFKVTSDKAVSAVWENNDVEGIQRFLRNFDGTREGLGNYLTNLDVPELPNVKAVDTYSKEAERGVNALKDIVYTSLARQINKIEMDVELDPAMKMERIKQTVINFQDKHQAKLEEIPGLEDMSENMTTTITNLSKYRQALTALDDRQNMSILRDVVGPGKSIINIMNKRSIAEEMDAFLNNKLASIDIEDLDLRAVAQAEANAIRLQLRQGFINEFTKNGVIQFEELDRVLATGTSSRNNLSLVLGEQEVLKLDTFRFLGRAMAEGETKFTEVLMNDSTLRKLETLGLPLGRIGSLLQRRAIFQPTTGYVAGAMATKILDSMGSKNTSRTMKLLVDRPFDILSLDQILLKEMDNLNPRDKNRLQEVVQNSKRHYRELVAWLPQHLSKHVRANMAYLGYEFSESEVVTMLEDVLYNDPRHPEINKETQEEEKPVAPKPTVENPEEPMTTQQLDKEPTREPEIVKLPEVTPVVTEEQPKVEPELPKVETNVLEQVTKQKMAKLTKAIGEPLSDADIAAGKTPDFDSIAKELKKAGFTYEEIKVLASEMINNSYPVILKEPEGSRKSDTPTSVTKGEGIPKSVKLLLSAYKKLDKEP